MATASTVANPYKITGGAVAASLKITDESVTIQKIVWYGATTAGHLLSVTDKAGNTLYKCSADAPGASGVLTYTDDFPLGLAASGVYCDDMDSGELYVYVK